MSNTNTFARLARAACAAGAVLTGAARADPFYQGGDVSLLPFIESRGGSFRDGGVNKPADRIMVEKGANLFRLRLFVNPNLSYSASQGAIQDLPATIALATRLKASGAKILLDFHYSDTWADPGRQNKPAAWSSLSFDGLKSRIHTYTRDSLLAFRDAGVMPELVQVGNEVTNGMLWSSGQVVYTGSTAVQNQSWRNFGDLLNAAIAGVRDVDATVPSQHTLVAIHADGGSVEDRAPYYYGKLTNTALVPPGSYDILGLSFYPSSTSGLTHLQGNLNFIANNTPLKAMVLEANQPWKGSANGSQWASTPAGQRDYWIAVRDAVRNLPAGKGLGALWWYPEAIQVPGVNIWKGGAIALFDDTGGDALPALNEFSIGGSAWAIDADGDWDTTGNWLGGVPSAADAIARFGPNLSAARTVSIDSTVTVNTISFLSGNAYTIAGAGSLVLDSGGGASRIEVVQGEHLIAVPATATGDLELSAAWTGSLSLSQPLNAGTSVVRKVGGGTVSVERIDAGLLDVQFGTLQLVGSMPSVVSGLNISAQGRVSLSDGLVLDVESDAMHATQAELRAWIAAGRFTGVIGYADASAIGLLSFLGVDVDSSAILLRATLAGDTNLDRAVDFDDLLLLAQHYGQAQAHWWQGDFDADGIVGFDDLLSLAQAYGTMFSTVVGRLPNGATLPYMDVQLALALIPEPTTAGMLLFGAAAIRRRR